MLLNLYFAQDDLPELALKGTPADDPAHARCRFPTAIDALPPHPENDALYVIEARGLPSAPPKNFKASVLCIGKPAGPWLDGRANLLFTESDVSALDVMNKLVRLFGFYQAWEESLQSTIDLDLPVSKFGESSVEVFGNPVLAQSHSYDMLFFALPSDDPESGLFRDYREDVYEPHVVDGALMVPKETAVQFNNDRRFAVLEKATKPVLFAGDTWSTISPHSLTFKSLLFNCRVDGRVVARVIVDEVVRPLRNKDRTLITVLGAYIARALQRASAAGAGGASRFARACEKLLDGNPVPPESIESLMSEIDWGAEDTYCCVVMRERDLAHSFSAVARISLALAANSIAIRHLLHRERSVLVCNLTAEGRCRDDVLDDIRAAVEDVEVIASSSTSYRGFENLRSFYRQALAVEEIGLRKNPTAHLHTFEDHPVDYVIAMCEASSSRMTIIPDNLRKLMAHDRRKGTGYAIALKAFLENDRSVAKTVRALYLSRSTFLYQIEKIKEILGDDLENPDMRLCLLIALRALGVGDGATRQEADRA